MKRLLLLAAALLPLLPALAEEAPSLAALQERFLDWRFGMFIHFNMATFNNRQWARIPDYAVKRLREIGTRLTAPQPAPDKP